MKSCSILYILALFLGINCLGQELKQSRKTSNLNAGNTILIRKTGDFEITGDSSAVNWKQTAWIYIPQRTSAGQNYSTRVKVLYSNTGIYFLYYCEDKKLSATLQGDFLDLWNEDVVEIFLQPDRNVPAYLEYELSPLNYELPIIIFNENGKLNSWQPFHYEGDRRTSHMTSIQGGEKKSNANADSWISEFFIPFALMKPVLKKVPVSGTTWNGNLYRIDYDSGEALWSWQLNSGNFHEFEKFGNFQFE